MSLTTGASPRSALSLDQARKHIRILNILPGDSDTISCTIATHHLDDAPPYSGLSYCWGTEAACCEILCNGVSVLVTPNLYAALKQLRQTPYTTLWIDFLCIDQSNKQEKNHQVALMGKIYRAAARTVVWLGPGGDEARQARSIVTVLAQAYQKHEDAFDGDISYTSDAGLATVGLPPWVRRREELAPVAALFLLPWWGRAWVIQEIALASDAILFWGQQSFSLDDMYNARRVLITIPGWQEHKDPVQLRGCMQAIWIRVICAHLRGEETESRNEEPALDLLQYSSPSVCSDPRDKVYSQVGILQLYLENKGTPLDLIPDYAASVDQVYMELTGELLRLGKWFAVLCRLRARDQTQMETLPSWCPNWNQSIESPHLYNACMLGIKPWEADQGSEKDYSISGRLLRLKGHPVDYVAAVSGIGLSEEQGSATQKDGSPDRQLISRLAHVIYTNENLRCENHMLPKGETEHSAFWSTYTMGISNDYVGNAPDVQDAPMFVRDGPEFERKVRELDRDPAASTDGLFRSIDELAFYGTDTLPPPASLVMARTRDGRYCFAPFETQPDDIIFLCAGGRTPFIARCIEGSKETRYRLLGGCYMRGVMFGEAWKPDLVEDMWFE